MNKASIAAAVLAAAAGAASAQTASPSTHRRRRLRARKRRAAGSVSKLTSGAASASRIGFRGVEDLGGGMSALFTLETGYRIDTGEVDAAGTIFNRQPLLA